MGLCCSLSEVISVESIAILMWLEMTGCLFPSKKGPDFGAAENQVLILVLSFINLVTLKNLLGHPEP